MSYEFTKKVIVNYLFYCKGVEVEEATAVYEKNAKEFNMLLSILGEDFVEKILFDIGEKSKEVE